MHGYFALLFCREGGQTREQAAQAVQTPSSGTSQPNQTWPGATGASPVRSALARCPWGLQPQSFGLCGREPLLLAVPRLRSPSCSP